MNTWSNKYTDNLNDQYTVQSQKFIHNIECTHKLELYESCMNFIFHMHHSCNIAEALEIFYDTTLVSGFNAGEAAGGVTGLALQVRWKLVKLSPGQPSTEGCTLCLLFLLLCDDPNTSADRQRRAFIVTCMPRRNRQQLEIRYFKAFKNKHCLWIPKYCVNIVASNVHLFVD